MSLTKMHAHITFNLFYIFTFKLKEKKILHINHAIILRKYTFLSYYYYTILMNYMYLITIYISIIWKAWQIKWDSPSICYIYTYTKMY